jgi:hypothetical protein
MLTAKQEHSMTALARQVAKVRSLLESNGLELWDTPAPTRISINHPPIDNWTMRIGDPKTKHDLFIDSGGGEHALWCEAEVKIAKFIADGKVDTDA